MNKQIGIFGFKLGENSYGITVPYYEYFSYFGDVHVLSPFPQDLSRFDLIAIPGGPDINPLRYEHIPMMSTQKSDPIREWFDLYMLPQAIQQGIPIVGICRGHQALAVHHGAYLEQEHYHEMTPSSDRTKLVHGIDVFTRQVPKELAKELEYKISHRGNKKTNHLILHQEVNSLHHQIVGNVPEQAVLLASYFNEKTPKIRPIEALYYPKIKAFSFQYHPEEIFDDLSVTCIEYLLENKNAEEEYVGQEVENVQEISE